MKESEINPVIREYCWQGVLGTLYHNYLQDKVDMIGNIQWYSDQGGSVALSNASIFVIVSAHNRQASIWRDRGMSGYLT